MKAFAVGRTTRTASALDRAARAWGRAGLLTHATWQVRMAPWPVCKRRKVMLHEKS